MTRLKHPIISFTLVFLQFALIAVLLFILPLSFHPAALIIQATAIIIGLWAVQTMHLGHFNILPDPMPTTELVTSGPYRYIRHPMYLSILLFFFPMVVLNLDWLSLSIYSNLFIILFIKLSYEEQLLVEKLKNYHQYQKMTKKLIPYIL